jgi:hypothetical protein
MVQKLRSYEYLSETKVEMFYSQTGGARRITGGEINIGFTGFKVGGKVDGIQQPSMYDMLQHVEDWIYTNRPPGSDDSKWIYGRLPLVVTHVDPAPPTVPIAQRQRVPPPIPRDRAAVLFISDADNETLVMVGSARHLIPTGHGPGEPLPPNWSSVHAIRHMIREFARPIGLTDQPVLGHIGGDYQWIRHGIDGVLETFWVGQQHREWCGDRTQLDPCEFLALRIGATTHEGKVYTLATPLFVGYVV